MASKKDQEKDTLTRKRAELILKVQSGQMTATDAAAALGVSRKTYYEWEEKALEGMLSALEDGNPGRPRKKVDKEKDRLKKRVQELEVDLKAHQTALKVRELLDPVFPPRKTKKDDQSKQSKTANKKKRQRKR